jgi:hypothetical protein
LVIAPALELTAKTTIAAATAARMTLRIGRNSLPSTSEERRVQRIDTRVYSEPVFDHVTIRVSNRPHRNPD